MAAVAPTGGPVLVASVCGPATLAVNGGASAAVSDAAANFAVIYVATASSVAPSDSLSNTWTALTGTGSNPYVNFYYSQGYTGGSSHTFTVTGGHQSPGFCLLSWSGMATSGVYETGTWAANGVQPNPLQPGSATPTFTGHNLFITGITGATGGIGQTYSINGSFSSPIDVAGSSVAYAAWVSYLVQVGQTAQNPSWSSNDPYQYSVGAIAIFKGAN